jgi:hypothetical protein
MGIRCSKAYPALEVHYRPKTYKQAKPELNKFFP